jgi:C-terminal processing protease CtpA/Prc
MKYQHRQFVTPMMQIGVICAFVLAAAATPAAGRETSAPTEGPAFAAQRLNLDLEQTPLGTLLTEITRQCSVTVSGLEERHQERISFAADNEPVEAALKRLLRSLDETNYAFFYNLTQLRQVSVLPRAKGAGPGSVEMPVAALPSEAEPPPAPAPESTVQAVRVIRVNAGTQAESLGLQRGDLVVAYDGAPVRNSQQLVAAVRETSDADTVEMVVVRDGEALRLSLKGGLIGINIKTVAVSDDELETE